MKKYGYTLAELLVAIGIIGVLLVLMFNAINTSRPNEEQLKMRKAHHELSRVMHELINDDDLYPETDGNFAGQYFANTNAITFKGRSYSGDSKFCELFGTRLSLRSSTACTAANADLDNGGHYTTTDGVVWVLPITTFKNSAGTDTVTGEIQIDVNGADGDNCFEFEDETYGYTPKDGCNLPDRFRFTIHSDGRIEIPAGDNITVQYLSSPSNTQKYKYLRENLKIKTEQQQSNT